MNCPCKGCHDRHYLCHGRCDKYQAWRKENEEAQARRQELKDSYPGICMTNMRKYWRGLTVNKRRYVKK